MFSTRYFNSSMVRLRVYQEGHKYVAPKFQFQYGAIKRVANLQNKIRRQISIPVWCD